MNVAAIQTLEKNGKERREGRGGERRARQKVKKEKRRGDGGYAHFSSIDGGAQTKLHACCKHF